LSILRIIRHFMLCHIITHILAEHLCSRLVLGAANLQKLFSKLPLNADSKSRIFCHGGKIHIGYTACQQKTGVVKLYTTSRGHSCALYSNSIVQMAYTQSVHGWSMGFQRERELSPSVLMKLSWGYRREQERSPDWRSNGQPFGHGSVQVERSFSKSCLMGFRGERSLLEWWCSGQTFSRVINRRYDLMAHEPPIPEIRQSGVYPTEGRSALFGKIACTTRTSCVSRKLPNSKMYYE
jgi:hypothetical protein